jgi:hypothetical protein
MSLFSAWVVYPVALLAICTGFGLLVDTLSGRRLPGVLLVPVGFAAFVVVAQVAIATDATAELILPLALSLAVAGAGLSLPWGFASPDPLPALVALGVFLAFGAPVLLSGDPTFAGYIKLDDTATWFALTDRAMQHGHSVAGLEPSTYRATLEFNLAGGYPVGTFLPFGAVQKLVGGDLAWVFQPYVAFLGATLSLSLWQVLARLIRYRWLLALAAFVAAQPALLYGYSLWGGVKEVAAAAAIALAAALAPAAVRRGATWRDGVPLAIACASLAAQLSVGGLVWVGPMLLALAAVAVRRFGSRGALAIAAPFAALLVLFSIPAMVGGLLPPSTPPITDPNAFGNLIDRLSPFQALGIWPAGDFRIDPSSTVATAVLVALGCLAAGIGFWAAAHNRAPALLLYCTALFGCVAIVAITSPWNGGKALATVSPLVLSLAVLGVASALRVDRWAGVLLLTAVAGGVLWSNILAYGGASLAPYAQLTELQHLGHRFAGQGPALLTEYNPYGARHFLRELDAEAPSELRSRDIPLAGGSVLGQGLSADTDELDLRGLFEFRTLVLPRSPLLSRPPLPYRLVSSGDRYEVWQRPEGAAAPSAFLPLGDRSNPAAVPGCAEVEALAAQAGPSTRLLAAPPELVYGASQGPFNLPRGGAYEAWLEGSIRASVELLVDGREVGAARHALSEDRGLIPLGSARLAPGSHRAELRFGGPDLHPGSADGGLVAPATGALLFSPAGTLASRLVSVAPHESSRLCGRPWDWIEAQGR